MKKYIVASLMSVALVGCASPHPKMLSFTPASVVIDYTGNDLHEATNMAQQFCSSIRKDAQYVDAKEEGWLGTKSTAFFNCVESPSRDNHHNNNGGNGGGGGAVGGNIVVIPNGNNGSTVRN